MRGTTCAQCDTAITEQNERCQACGAPVLTPAPVDLTDNDPNNLRVRVLLEQARRHQQDGNLIMALRVAREAERLRPDCSTVHALLGQLYEQSGDLASAHQHFQQALTISSTPGADDCLVTPPVPPETTRPTHGWWITLVLIGCVLFSGIATLFALLPGEHQDTRGNILQRQQKATVTPLPPAKDPLPDVQIPPPAQNAHASTPDSERRVSDPGMAERLYIPAPAPTPKPSPTPVAPPLPLAPPDSTVTKTASDGTPVAFVLGPGASRGSRITASDPSQEDADNAFFTGKFERATAMYEALISTQERPDPRLQQNLATCYQRLGNSKKAEEHLQGAVKGYQAQVSERPDDAAAQQNLKSCQANLQTLRVTHETMAP